MMNIQYIEARDLGDAWFQTIYRLLEEGKEFTIDRGSYAGQKRIEFDYVTVNIKYPGTRPLLPKIEQHFGIPDPVEADYLDDYLPYLMTGELKEGEAYTYGQRLTKYPIDYPIDKCKSLPWNGILIDEIDTLLDEGIIIQEDKFYLNQIELLIWTYKNKGYRNNQMVLQVAHPTDMLLKDPPCLRQIDTRIQDDQIHFYPNFRSWDAWGGFPANLGGIQLLKEYVSSCIGVNDGNIIASSKGLHIYDYSLSLAKDLRMIKSAW